MSRPCAWIGRAKSVGCFSLNLGMLGLWPHSGYEVVRCKWMVLWRGVVLLVPPPLSQLYKCLLQFPLSNRLSPFYMKTWQQDSLILIKTWRKREEINIWKIESLKKKFVLFDSFQIVIIIGSIFFFFIVLFLFLFSCQVNKMLELNY